MVVILPRFTWYSDIVFSLCTIATSRLGLSDSHCQCHCQEIVKIIGMLGLPYMSYVIPYRDWVFIREDDKNLHFLLSSILKNHSGCDTTIKTMSTSFTQNSQCQSGNLLAHAIRIHPGQDLVPALKKVAQEAIEKSGPSSSSSSSAFILSAVGSLEFVRLRMANACRNVVEGDMNTQNLSSNEIKDWNERLEIVSLTGTFSAGGKMHVHMSVSDKDGNVIGGHLVEGKIFTTLELVMGTIQGVSFTREFDSATGYDELVVRQVS